MISGAAESSHILNKIVHPYFLYLYISTQILTSYQPNSGLKPGFYLLLSWLAPI
jgi:hypothetical protein